MLPLDTPFSLAIVLEEYIDAAALKTQTEKQVDCFMDHPVSGQPRVQLVDGQEGTPEGAHHVLQEEDEQVVGPTSLGVASKHTLWQ